MNELCPSDFKIILVKSLTETETYELKDLLPFGFNSKKGGNYYGRKKNRIKEYRKGVYC